MLMVNVQNKSDVNVSIWLPFRSGIAAVGSPKQLFTCALSAAVNQSDRSSESAKSVKRLSKVYSTAAGPSCSIILNRMLLEITRVSNRHYEIRIEINPCLPDVTKKAKNKKPIHLHFQPTKHFDLSSSCLIARIRWCEN